MVYLLCIHYILLLYNFRIRLIDLLYFFFFELQDMGQKRSTSHPQLEAEKKKTDKSSSQPSPILVIPSIKYNTGGTFISALLRGESAIGRH